MSWKFSYSKPPAVETQTVTKWHTFGNAAIRSSTIDHVSVHEHWWFEGGGCSLKLTTAQHTFTAETTSCDEAKALMKRLVDSFLKSE